MVEQKDAYEFDFLFDCDMQAVLHISTVTKSRISRWVMRGVITLLANFLKLTLPLPESTKA